MIYMVQSPLCNIRQLSILCTTFLLLLTWRCFLWTTFNVALFPAAIQLLFQCIGLFDSRKHTTKKEGKENTEYFVYSKHERMDTQEIFKNACGIIKEAVEADNQKEYEKALKLYQKALQYFVHLCRCKWPTTSQCSSFVYGKEERVHLYVHYVVIYSPR